MSTSRSFSAAFCAVAIVFAAPAIAGAPSSELEGELKRQADQRRAAEKPSGEMQGGSGAMTNGGGNSRSSSGDSQATNENVDASGSDKGLDGFARDVPLSVAMRQIVPDRYDIAYGPDVDTNQTVSWNGRGRAWERVAINVASNNGMTVAVDQGPQRVTVRSEDKKRTGGSGFRLVPQAKGQDGTGSDDGDAAAKRKASKSSDQSGSAQKSDGDGVFQVKKGDKAVWQVESGSTLRSALMRWSEKPEAGWRVVYKSDWTYQIEASATFDGSFVEAAESLIKSFRNVKPAPAAKAWKGNRVLVVETPNGKIVE